MIDVKLPYSYRKNPDIPSFPDNKPVFVFDGTCGMCSSSVVWIMKHDKHDIFRFVPAQSPLGQALYKHYGFSPDETHILISNGFAYTKSSGYLRMLEKLGGAWLFLEVLFLVPKVVRDFIYDRVARNRYSFKGKTEYCQLIPEEMKGKLLSS